MSSPVIDVKPTGRSSVRRVKRRRIDMTNMTEFFKAPDARRLLLSGVPQDARVVGVHVDEVTPHGVNVFLESAEFPEVGEGAVPPELVVLMTVLGSPKANDAAPSADEFVPEVTRCCWGDRND